MSTTSTAIEWTDRTWNPVRGCSRISEGCRNCYAEKQAARFVGPGQAYEGLLTITTKEKRVGISDVTRVVRSAKWNGVMRLVPHTLDEPLSWRRPVRVFVNSMSDLFHEGLDDGAIAAVFGIMAASPQHTFQVLTKRAERMRAWMEWALAETRSRFTGPALAEIGARFVRSIGGDEDVLYKAANRAVGRGAPFRNVWLGVSVEDQRTADERIPHLLATPAAVRFVSYEPALASVDFLSFVMASPAIDWLIVGGESGPNARPFDVRWAERVIETCKGTPTRVFVKQLGALPYRYDPGPAFSESATVFRKAPPQRYFGRDYDGWPYHVAIPPLQDGKGGDIMEWPEALRVREFPTMEAS